MGAIAYVVEMWGEPRYASDSRYAAERWLETAKQGSVLSKLPYNAGCRVVPVPFSQHDQSAINQGRNHGTY